MNEMNEMNKKNHRRESKAWLMTLLIGIPVSFLIVGHFFVRAFSETPVNLSLLGEGFVSACLMGIPVIAASAILWFMRYSKLPSLAFVVTLITGGFFLLFSGAEFISEIVNGGGFNAIIGGLIEMASFGVPFLVIAWLLWTRPKIGSALLVLIGIATAVLMFSDWSMPKDPSDLIIPVMLSGFPVVLGLYTFIREQKMGMQKTRLTSTV